jgi:hypothetical protein
MKEEIILYANGCVVRRKNKRVLSRKLPQDEIGIELYNMVDKGKEDAKIVFAKIEKRRSKLLFKVSRQGAEDLVIALMETLKIETENQTVK